MNIGMVCYPTFGGSGVVATELGKALAQRGHTVHFITYDRPVRLDTYSQHIFYHQVNPEDYPLFDFLPYESALASKLVEVVLHHQLDLLHVHYAIPHASSTYLAQQILRQQHACVPFTTTLHGTDITLVGATEMYGPVVTFSINQSNGVTAVSDYLRRATLQNFKITRPIEVIPNFVDLQRFHVENRPELRQQITPEGQRLLIHVSNFRKVKRVQDVYEMFRLLRQRLPVRLLFVGDGPERSPLERSIYQHGLEKEVVFLGKQEVIEQILPVADAFVMPSETESFGLAALEAMACGLPVLATDAGGIPEVVEHGISGLLSPVGDVQTLAANAFYLLSDPARHAAFAQAARARAVAFDVQAIVPHYEAHYRQVIADYARLRNQVDC